MLPPYTVPLTEVELATLGRICASWAQVDILMDWICEEAFSISPQKRMVLMGDKMVGSKVAITKKALHFLPESDGRRASAEFFTLAELVAGRRNHAIHGVWGHKIGDNPEDTFVGARSHRAPDKPVRADQLAEIEEAINQCAQVGQRAIFLLKGRELLPEGSQVEFIYGDLEGPPDWLLEGV